MHLFGFLGRRFGWSMPYLSAWPEVLIMMVLVLVIMMMMMIIITISLMATRG